MKRTVYNLGINDFLLLCTAIVVFISIVAHSMIASYAVANAMAHVVDPLARKSSFGIGQSQQVLKQTTTIPYNLREVRLPRNGVYNANQSSERDFVSLMRRGIGYAAGRYPQAFGWFLPLPFLLPYFAHLAVVYLVPRSYALVRPMYEIRVVLGFGQRALLSSLGGLLVLIYFQLARMFWGSEAWNGSYFLSVEYGWIAFYLFFILCILLYVSLVFISSGVRVKLKHSVGQGPCVHCGYSCVAGSTCPECGLDTGWFIRPKIRPNILGLTVMAIAAFCSPVLVASVYSVLGLA